MMKKTVFSFVLAALLPVSVQAAPQTAAAAAKTAPQAAAPVIERSAVAPEIAAAAYIVTDLQSGSTLAANHADTEIEPAALTKMMTAYLVFKALENGTLKAEQKVNVSDTAWKAEGSRMFLDRKTPVSIGDLIKGMAVASGNDAALTLAEAAGGSVAAFVGKMNEEAARLGMKHTRFKNPTGLPEEGQVSTVRDLAVLAAALIRDYPKYYPVFSLKSFKYNQIEQPNRNLLLYRDSSVDGLSVGHADSAGYHLTASSKRNGRRVVSVVAGAESTEARASESSKLLNWALQSFDTPKLYRGGEAVSSVKVYRGDAQSVAVGFTDDAYITISHDTGRSLKPILQTVQPVLAPIRKGQVLGRLKLVDNGKTVAEKDVVALEDVAEGGWLSRVWDSIVLWFKGLFGGASAQA